MTLPAGLEVRWLGVSGYRLSYQDQVLVIDPYLSRVPLSAVLRRAPALPAPGLVERYIGTDASVVGVLVGHTHFDHAVDAPAVARRFGCPAYGSDSLVRLMALHGLASQAVEVVPHRRYELGPFSVSFTPSLHSKLVLGLAVPMDGELCCEHLDALTPGAYRCGQVYGIRIDVAGMSFYHQGSANLIDDEIRAPRRRVPRRRRRTGLHPRLLGAECSRACRRRSSYRRTTTTSSGPSTRPWDSRRTSTSRGARRDRRRQPRDRGGRAADHLRR